jgi:excisionase family DNA binding protein
MTENKPTYINVAQAAEITGICADTIRKLAKQPGFPCVIIGRRYIINEDRLYQWMLDHEGKEVVVD